MLTPFDNMSDASRLWIYQANRNISGQEQKDIMIATEQFLRQWAAHGSDLMASATIKHDRFLIIATDESFNMASGCSIDSSVHFVQGLGQQFNIDFFVRTDLAFLNEQTVEIVPLNALKEAVASGQIGAESRFFDNTVAQKGQLRDQWLKKASETWLKRYFKPTLNV